MSAPIGSCQELRTEGTQHIGGKQAKGVIAALKHGIGAELANMRATEQIDAI